MINDFFNLIFPRLCCSCNTTLLKHEKLICSLCIATLPKTNYHLDADNPLVKVFWGRVPVSMVASYYSFSAKSRVQNLLYQLKYNGIKEVGKEIGRLYGWELNQSPYFKNIDCIIPVPLHPSKLKQRGFNQSEWFAIGLSESMNIPIYNSVIERVIDTSTQTKKSRYNRWENVAGIFQVTNNIVAGKTILLVDDVITTGATIEASVMSLSKYDCKIVIAAIASA